jgi:hypothetical protein
MSSSEDSEEFAIIAVQEEKLKELMGDMLLC